MEKKISHEEMELIEKYRQLEPKYKEVLQVTIAAMLADPNQAIRKA